MGRKTELKSGYAGEPGLWPMADISLETVALRCQPGTDFNSNLTG